MEWAADPRQFVAEVHPKDASKVLSALHRNGVRGLTSVAMRQDSRYTSLQNPWASLLSCFDWDSSPYGSGVSTIAQLRLQQWRSNGLSLSLASVNLIRSASIRELEATLRRVLADPALLDGDITVDVVLSPDIPAPDRIVVWSAGSSVGVSSPLVLASIGRNPQVTTLLKGVASDIEAVLGRPVCIDFEVAGDTLLCSRIAPDSTAIRDFATYIQRRLETGSSLTSLLGLLSEETLGPSPVDHTALPVPILTGYGIGRLPASGPAVFSVESAIASISDDHRPILIVREVSGQALSIAEQLSGVVSQVGGPCSHFIEAIVGMSVPVISPVATPMTVDSHSMRSNSRVIREGDWLTLDPSRGSIHIVDNSRVIDGRRESNQTAHLIPRVVQTAGFDILADVCELPSSFRTFAACDRPEVARSALARGADGIGLCRSEVVLFQPAISERIVRHMFDSFGTDEGPSIPCSSATEALDAHFRSMVEACAGSELIYRLADPDLLDLLEANVNTAGETLPALRLAAASQFSDLRGFRFSDLVGGLYESQVAGVADVLGGWPEEQQERVAIVLPQTIGPDDIARLRELLRRHRLAVRCGIMVEHPALALNAASLANCDVVCIGTNDLEQLVSGQRRVSPLARMPGRGKIEFNAAGLAPFLQSVSDHLRMIPNCELHLCGSLTYQSAALELASRSGFDVVSTAPQRLDEVRLESRRLAASVTRDRHGRNWSAASLSQSVTETMLNQVASSLVLGNREVAQGIAVSWADGLLSHTGVSLSFGWKFLKRDLVDRWFGFREHRRFLWPWDPQDVLVYVRRLQAKGRSARLSVFSPGIASHAPSRRLSPMVDVSDILELAVRRADLEVFPEPSPDSLAFRLRFDESPVVTFEAGVGQAMYLFEGERGQHPVAVGTWSPNSDPEGQLDLSISAPPRAESIGDLEAQTRRLISRHVPDLSLLARAARLDVAIPWVGIEGYMGNDQPDEPEGLLQSLLVVDVALPFDVAFQAT